MRRNGKVPARPEGVCLVRVDGSRLNVELVYEGTNESGLHEWRACGVEIRDGDLIEIERLPAYTVVTWAWA